MSLRASCPEAAKSNFLCEKQESTGHFPTLCNHLYLAAQVTQSGTLNSFTHYIKKPSRQHVKRKNIFLYTLIRHLTRNQSQNFPESLTVLYQPMTATSRFSINGSSRVCMYAHAHMCMLEILTICSNREGSLTSPRPALWKILRSFMFLCSQTPNPPIFIFFTASEYNPSQLSWVLLWRQQKVKSASLFLFKQPYFCIKLSVQS